MSKDSITWPVYADTGLERLANASRVDRHSWNLPCKHPGRQTLWSTSGIYLGVIFRPALQLRLHLPRHPTAGEPANWLCSQGVPYLTAELEITARRPFDASGQALFGPPEGLSDVGMFSVSSRTSRVPPALCASPSSPQINMATGVTRERKRVAVHISVSTSVNSKSSCVLGAAASTDLLALSEKGHFRRCLCTTGGWRREASQD